MPTGFSVIVSEENEPKDPSMANYILPIATSQTTINQNKEPKEPLEASQSNNTQIELIERA